MRKHLIALGIIFLLNPLNVKAKEITVTLAKCVDGDTAQFNINNEKKRTRFLAINTPESVHPTKGNEIYGKDASTYTCEKLTNAKKIVLEFDEKADQTDKYGRVLAWVFVDGELLQKDLIKNGYAEVAYLYGKYKYVSLLQEEEQKEKNEKKGIWSDEIQKERALQEKKEQTKNNSKKNETESLKEIIFKEINEIFKKLATKLLKKIESMI